MKSPLVAALAAAGRIDQFLLRSRHAALRFVEGVTLHALDEKELLRLGIALFTATPWYREGTMFPWEETWLGARLPKPPARVLVGACGAGREVAWLVERGYDVGAFDPTPALLELARRRAPRARIEEMSFVDFNADVRFDGDFDAVVITFGSFSFALSDRTRVELLRTCARICPRGPILLSWLSAPVPEQQRAELPGRLSRAGRRVGRALGALRGVARDADGDSLRADAGVVHLLRNDELVELARRADLQVTLEGGDYAHATLLPLRKKRRADVVEELMQHVDVLARGRRQSIVARGRSMTPAIPHESRVELAPIEQPARGGRASTLRLGDVVAANVSGKRVIHRVVGIDARGAVLLKGDAVRSPDGWVTPDDVIARAVDVPAARRRLTRFERARGRVARAWHALR